MSRPFLPKPLLADGYPGHEDDVQPPSEKQPKSCPACVTHSKSVPPNQQDSKPQPAEKHRRKERTYPLQSPKAVQKEATEAEAQGCKMTWIVTNSLQVFRPGDWPMDTNCVLHLFYYGTSSRPLQSTNFNQWAGSWRSWRKSEEGGFLSSCSGLCEGWQGQEKEKTRKREDNGKEAQAMSSCSYQNMVAEQGDCKTHHWVHWISLQQTDYQEL